ncbi:unnamed protein product, partial [marine sediment metagenome]
MKKVLISILLPVLLLTFVMGSTYAAGPLPRFLVAIEGPSGPVEKAVIASGGKVTHVYEMLPKWIAIEISEAGKLGLLRNPRIGKIEKDAEVHAIGQTLPWGVDRIDAELVHP